MSFIIYILSLSFARENFPRPIQAVIYTTCNLRDHIGRAKLPDIETIGIAAHACGSCLKDSHCKICELIPCRPKQVRAAVPSLLWPSRLLQREAGNSCFVVCLVRLTIRWSNKFFVFSKQISAFVSIITKAVSLMVVFPEVVGFTNILHRMIIMCLLSLSSTAARLVTWMFVNATGSLSWNRCIPLTSIA